MNNEDLNISFLKILKKMSAFDVALLYLRIYKGIKLYDMADIFFVSHESIRLYLNKIYDRIRNEI
jgi:hypothetical protein